MFASYATWLLLGSCYTIYFFRCICVQFKFGGAHTQARVPCCLKCQSAAVISFQLTKLLSKAIASAKGFFPLSSGSKWQLNRLGWAFVWALTEGFHLHAYKPNASYSWLVAETLSSCFFFFFFFGGGLLICPWSHKLLLFCWESSKCPWMEHRVFSKHLQLGYKLSHND